MHAGETAVEAGATPELTHPVDGQGCPEIFRNYPGCPTCIERAHRSGCHEQCAADQICQRSRFHQSPCDGERRYEVKVIDQDDRVLLWDFAYVLVHSTGPSSAAIRVASDLRFAFERDGSVLDYSVQAVDLQDGRTAYAGYRRHWEDTHGWYEPEPGDRLFELDYSFYDGEEGYRYFARWRNAFKASSELFDKNPNRRLRRRILRDVPLDPQIVPEDAPAHPEAAQ